MKLKLVICLVCVVLPIRLYAFDQSPQSFYCPQKHGYVNVGMSAEQVLAACGEPLSRQDSNNPVYVRVPVKQLIYNNMGTDRPYAWYIHSWDFSSLRSGSGGVQMEMNIIDYKVKLIRINGSNSNATSACNGINIEINDSVAKVYNACGTPAMVNNTFVNMQTTPTMKPQLWIYQANEYQQPFTLPSLMANYKKSTYLIRIHTNDRDYRGYHRIL